MTTIRDYRDSFIQALSPLYGEQEAESFFYLTLEDFRRMRRIDLAMNPKSAMGEEEQAQWDLVVSQLLRQVPVQYILGNAHFYGRTFEVNDSVLIPRAETEELVQWIVADLQKPGAPGVSILDIGTGSGCIAVTLACELPGAKVSALDISPSALRMAIANASRNHAAISVIEANILQTDELPAFDVIVSNPPYVRQREKDAMKPNVLEHEPHLALFVPDDDALVFYRKIAALASKSLSPGGALYFEINQYLAKETMDLLENFGASAIELRRDLYGNDRMIRAKW
jgi:release factor glutamine methyltransferase